MVLQDVCSGVAKWVAVMLLGSCYGVGKWFVKCPRWLLWVKRITDFLKKKEMVGI